jgi:hypothetical protein
LFSATVPAEKSELSPQSIVAVQGHWKFEYEATTPEKLAPSTAAMVLPPPVGACPAAGAAVESAVSRTRSRTRRRIGGP